MKRSTLWIIGIATAIVTSTGLRAAVGHSYYGHHGFNRQHTCRSEGDAGDKINPAQQTDSTIRR